MRSTPRPENIVAATATRPALGARSVDVTLVAIVAQQPKRAVRVVSAVAAALTAVGVRVPVLVQWLRAGRALALAHIAHDLAGAVEQLVQIERSWNVIVLDKFGAWASKCQLGLCLCFRLASRTGVVVAAVHIGEASAVRGRRPAPHDANRGRVSVLRAPSEVIGDGHVLYGVKGV